MPTSFEELREKSKGLSTNKKAELARILIEQLDQSADANAEHAWLEEAQRRYAAYLAGELGSLPGDEVIKRARQRLK